MKKHLINVLKFLLFLSIGVVILYFVYQKQNTAYIENCKLEGIPLDECSLIDKIWTDFTGVNFFWLFSVLIAFTISNLSRALRWNLLIRPLGYQPKSINSFFSVMVGYFANLFLPRAGELVRAGTMSRYEQIPVEKLIGTIVVGRIFDVISILTVTAACFLLEYDKIWAETQRLLALEETSAGGSGGTTILIIGLMIILVLLALLFFFRSVIFESKIYHKAVNIIKGFWQGIQSIRQLEKPWLFAFHSINIWFMYFAMTYLCFFAFAPTASLPAIAGLIVFVFGGWGIVVPSPGGMGTYHFMVVTALALYGVGGDDAFSFANISFFSINLGCNVLMGILGLLLLPILNKNYVPAQPATQGVS
ncbi:MAG: lysylphosphatidylglycerol synthase transmembrane domain-containing protein [Saprospiraceae bacterium]